MITLQTPRASEKPYSTARGGEDHHPPPSVASLAQ